MIGISWIKRTFTTLRKEPEENKIYLVWIEGIKNDGKTFPMKAVSAEDYLDATYAYMDEYSDVTFFGMEVSPYHIATVKVCVKETQGKRSQTIRYFI